MSGITDAEFRQFQRFIYQAAGISMSPSKKALVVGRLARRLQKHRLTSYSEYFELLQSPGAPEEAQIAVDLLTTNETYFFREPKHFDLLRDLASAASQRAGPFRVWSAASSSGEEAYSIAMVLADRLPGAPWEVVGSDISSRVLEVARRGLYSRARTSQIPAEYLQRFCLKGVGPQEGTVLVDRALRSRVQFVQVNLNDSLPQLGQFDVIFLRNVMIYFDMDTKRGVVARILSLLKPGGHFAIGHSETLNNINDTIECLRPSIYRKA
jgi:chemotaxis protein methyltransferase CheR